MVFYVCARNSIMRSSSCFVRASALYAQRPEHPRPDFGAPKWMTLNGQWEFGFTDKFGGKITVRSAGERAFGVHRQAKPSAGTERTFESPASWTGKHAWLHFDAVDAEAHVWVNGQDIGTHHGGYSPFEFDLNKVAKPGDMATVIVARRI